MRRSRLGVPLHVDPGGRTIGGKDPVRVAKESRVSFVLRRSIPSMSGLVALLVAVGFAAVGFLGAPVWFPAVFAVVMVLVQYAVNPFILQWLVPAIPVEHDGERYNLDHPLAGIVARRCREAGIPLVRLGIVDD